MCVRSPGARTSMRRLRSCAWATTRMFEIKMLPAREGDCLWLRYGDAKKPRQILFDAGRAATAVELKARFRALKRAERRFELLVISHVDRDHIEGALSLLT